MELFASFLYAMILALCGIMAVVGLWNLFWWCLGSILGIKELK
jgi:hypothetical protein